MKRFEGESSNDDNGYLSDNEVKEDMYIHELLIWDSLDTYNRLQSEKAMTAEFISKELSKMHILMIRDQVSVQYNSH